MVIACGVWSPRIAKHGRRLDPAHPGRPPDDRRGPGAALRRLEERDRVPDRARHGHEHVRAPGRVSGLEVGSYAHRPILHDPEEIPSIEESALTPTELPFTQDDFVQQMEDALQLMPEILGDESVGIKYAINGLLSLTPDGLPILGETQRGARALVRRRGVGEGGPGRGPRRGRVDGRGRARDRPPGLRRRALLRAPEDARVRAEPRRRGLQQDLRDRAPGRAVGVVPADPALAVLRARAGARRGLLRGRRLGAAALVRRRTRRCSRSSRTRSTTARPSGTRAGGRRSSTPSTSRCATAPRCSTSPRSASSTSSARARSSACRRCRCGRWT